MRIGAIDKFTLIDFPNRTAAIIFTQGCNFRCPFCHNPELVLPKKFETPIALEEVFAFLDKRKGLLDGVEFTGGEPTLQSDLIMVMEKIKQKGFQIKLDTNGTNPAVLKEALQKKLVDYVAMDIKSSVEKYNEIAGVSVDTEKIKESIEIIKKLAPEYEFRTTVINGFHDKKEMEEIGKLIGGAKQYFIQVPHFDKTVKEGFSAPLFSRETLEEFCSIIKSYGTENCKIR